MTENSAPLSQADAARIRRRRRRAAKAEMRDACFQALADGFTHEQIAKARGVGVATVRREIDRAIAARRVQAPEKHVRLQIARATKALALLDLRLSNGEMAAVGPFQPLFACWISALSRRTSVMTMAPRRRSIRPLRSIALISRDTVSRRVLMRAASSD